MNHQQPNSLLLVPNSSGTERPELQAPKNACDCHLHILDERFPTATPGTIAAKEATAADYRLLQQRIGTTRAVIVQAKDFGTDNSCTLNAIEQLGVANTRGIAVLNPDVSDAELHRLNAGGIRGLRFSVWNPRNAITSIDMIEPLAKRICDLGWHVQLHMSGDQIAANSSLLDRIPCPIVFDHMGRLSPQQGINHPAFAIICRLIDKGHTWVKLSGAYLNTESGAPVYEDASSVARAFAVAAPERAVWGSDWPHVTEKNKPDDSLLFDLLTNWAPNAHATHRILVDNPATLYGWSV